MINIRNATHYDLNLIIGFIRALADYERLGHEMNADPAVMAQHLFGPHPKAEVIIGEIEGEPRGFALFFHNFSTFEGRPGIYLEDLFVSPQARGFGLGKALLAHLAQLAITRDCARLEWAVLDWNEPALKFYQSIAAKPMDEWTIHRLGGASLKRLATL